MDDKAFKLGSFLTATIAAVIPLTTAVAKVFETEQQAKKFEHESQMRYIDLLVSDGGQRDWYFRRDVLSFYSEVLPQDHPVKAWAQKELEVAERKVKELDELKAEQVEAEIDLSRELVRTAALASPDPGVIVAPGPDSTPSVTTPPKTPSTPPQTQAPTATTPKPTVTKASAAKVEAAAVINRKIAMESQRGALPMAPPPPAPEAAGP